MAGTIRQLPTDRLVPGRNHRKHFDEAALAELAASLSRRGVLQNLVVRRHPRQRGRFEIIAGERRWRAAKLAKLDRLPCCVVRASDAEALRLGLVENVQRADVTPLEEADAYAELRDRHHMAADKIAAAVGKPPAHVHQRLLLCRLSPQTRGLVAGGYLSAAAAFHIARLEEAADQMRVALIAVGRELRDREVAAMVSVLVNGDGEPKQGELLDVPALSKREQAARERFRRALEKAAAVLEAAWDAVAQATSRKVLRSVVEADLARVQLLRRWLGRLEADLAAELGRRNLVEPARRKGRATRQGSRRQTPKTGAKGRKRSVLTGGQSRREN